jgi:hypothetical protein
MSDLIRSHARVLLSGPRSPLGRRIRGEAGGSPDSQDPCPQLPPSLRKTGERLEAAALESSTKSGYHSQVYGQANGYEPVVRALGFPASKIWPASTEAVKAWLAWLLQYGVKSGAKYLSGLKDAHLDKGLPFLADSVGAAKLARWRTGSRQLAKTFPATSAPKKATFAITALILRRMCRCESIRGSRRGRLLLAFSAVAVYAGNRGGEIFPKPPSANRGERERTRVSGDLLLSALEFGDESLGGGMTITYPPMKTEKGKSTSLWFPTLPGDLTCPVTLMRAYIADRGAAPRKSEPLFAEEDGSSLSRTSCLKWTREALATASIEIPPSQKLGSKSWRAGAAQSASALPADIDDQVKASGRWRSTAFKPYLGGKAAHRIVAIAYASRLLLERLDQQVPADNSNQVPSAEREVSSSEDSLPGSEAAPVAASPSPTQPEVDEELAAEPAIRHTLAADASRELNRVGREPSARRESVVPGFDSTLVLFGEDACRSMRPQIR